MGLRRGNIRSEDFEWISNRDLVDSAHMLMGEIDLDPAFLHTSHTSGTKRMTGGKQREVCPPPLPQATPCGGER
jgi:hypothetical protein